MPNILNHQVEASSNTEQKQLPKEHKALEDFFGNNTQQHLRKLEEHIEKDKERVERIGSYLGFMDL